MILKKKKNIKNRANLSNCMRTFPPHYRPSTRPIGVKTHCEIILFSIKHNNDFRTRKGNQDMLIRRTGSTSTVL